MIKIPRLFKPWEWFKSDERKQIKELYEKYDSLTALLQKNSATKASQTAVPASARAFKSMRYIGGNLIVVLNDGIILTKNTATKDDLDVALKFATEEEIIAFFTSNEVKEKLREEEAKKSIQIDTAEERQIVKDNLHALRGNPDFEIEGDSVYLTGVRLAMPALVSGSFIEILEKIQLANSKGEDVSELSNHYQALKMFWLKLALNPIPQSRLDLLGFVRRNDVRITQNGNLILYRRIVSTKERADKKLVAAISQFYAKVKKNKKSPKNYNLLYDGKSYSVAKNNAAATAVLSEGIKLEGNLKDLYDNLPNMEQNIYTSAHSKSVTIKIGGIYLIPDSEIDLNNGICASGGLHAACKDYDYSSFGDTPVVVLVSPSKAITVPKSDGGKLRTTEMFVACVNNAAHGQHFANGSLSVFDEEYNNYTLAALEEVLKGKSLDALDIKGEKPAVQLKDVEQIVNHIRGRIVTVEK